ncbi:MAG: dTDP-4-dehydrorhamnose reductase [Spirochaetia bacterium]|nr:dTDP-4-dehydrorhamnose reductase [Spirochaetia bacterium]MDY5886635.1 dTDP-4-dehydrorhamnose reductase [Treponema sp.]
MIWLIGCKGMLGTEIARQLTENKIEFVGTDIDVDITNPKAMAEFVKDKSISYIINCSAYTAVDKAESDTEFAKKLNEDGPGNIANLANQIHAKMIHISTDYVFDGTGDTPRTEDMSVAPIGVYGVTKAAGEAAVRQNLKEYYILRTAWLYGWAGKNFVYTMIRAMNTHEAVKVVNDQKGTPTFAGDLADVIIKIMNKETVPYGIYHCTDLGEITWWDFTNEIKKQGIEVGWINETGKKCTVNPCTTEEYPTPAKRPAYSVLSKEKIQKTLGITLPDWKESLNVFLKSTLFDKSRIE